MTFTLEHLDFFLLILVRISGFMVAAPIFSLRNIPMRVKTLLAISIAMLLFHVLPVEEVEYTTTIEYTLLVISEMLAGVIMGFMANVSYYILSFAGQIIDQEMGFSMVNQYDPITSTQVTITGNLYTYAVLLMLFATNMHHYLIRAITDSFTVLPVGTVSLDTGIYVLMKRFIVDYFVIGFRIVLPIFASMLVVNTVLAILAKVAPQLSMFVIGLQLKVFVGLVVLIIMIMLLNGVTDLIFREMMSMLKESIPYFGGTGS